MNTMTPAEYGAYIGRCVAREVIAGLITYAGLEDYDAVRDRIACNLDLHYLEAANNHRFSAVLAANNSFFEYLDMHAACRY